MDVYFLSGLGADKRAFKNIKLSEQHQVHHIEWLRPVEKESIFQYSGRIASLIDSSGDFAIIGFSFGGILTVELLKTLKPKHAILISSIASRKEMPGSFKFFGNVNLDKLVPSMAFNKVYPFAHLFTGLKSQEDKQLWAEIMRDSDPYFLKWAIHELLNWKNTSRPDNIFHIHGNADKTFPVKLVRADRVIEGGGHYMVLSHCREISAIINEQLSCN
jgi:pimeloyl-ACP methyl ester carboxylesterase